MIAELLKMIDAFRAGVGAARAVMEGRGTVVRVDELEAKELCSCPDPRAVLIHGKGTLCGDGQYEHLNESLGGETVAPIGDVLDLLAWEADRRDGVIR